MKIQVSCSNLSTIYHDNENFRNYEYAKNLFEQAVNAGSLDGGNEFE